MKMSTNLPENWTCHHHIDETDGLSYQYYYNEVTKQCLWELPEPIVSVKEDLYVDDIYGSDVDDNNEHNGGTLCGDDCPYVMPKFDVPENRLREGNDRHGDDDGDSPHVINQDYLNMARQYKTQRLYSDHKVAQICVLCNKRSATHVLFPCEHRCLCNVCIDKEEICADNKMVERTHGYCNCPLCATVIKKIILFDAGNEVEEYWQWVYEFKPSFSDKFKKRWKHSAGMIDKLYVQRKEGTNENTRRRLSSRSCALM